MTPILPRQMLWKDKQTIDEFFELDPVNEDFFDVFVSLCEEPFALQADEVKVFNEVYYQVTRMVFEHPLPTDLPKYISDIKANIGWNYSAELVMSMAYYLISLIEKHERPLNKFFTKAVNERFGGCLFWKPFKHRFEKLRKEKRTVKYSFLPQPVEVEWLKDKYVHWNTITCNYDLLCIEKVINLWKSIDDKREVAVMINDSVDFGTPLRNAADKAHIKHFMEVYMIADESAPIWKCAEKLPETDYKILNERINELEKDKRVLMGRINELEADNQRLNALLERKKRIGKARKFTLVQIVEYCKSCVVWDDVKSIVAMLNKLLRRIATEEDNVLVDSIEDEFKNRLLGTVNIANQTVIPQVGNYMPQIQTQTMNLPVPPIGQDEQKLLEDE